MAESRSMEDQIIRQRLDNAMQHWERLAEIQLQQFHARLDGILVQQQRVTEIEGRHDGMPLTPVERQERFDDLLQDMQHDRIAYQEANVLAAIDRQLERLQHRFVDSAMGAGGVNPLAQDPVEGFYAAGNGLEDDRVDAADATRLAQLHERLDALQQTRQQEQQRSHEQGLGF